MATSGTANYCIRLVGPATGRFIGELDPDRLLLRTTSRRVTETIDVAQLLADYHARQAGGTVTPG